MTKGTISLQAGTILAFIFSSMTGGAAFAQSAPLQLGPIALAGDAPSYLDLGVGAFDLQGVERAGTVAEGRVEYRSGRKLFFLGPAAGLLANAKGGVFGYGGFYFDLAWNHFVVTPLAAVGGYHRGGSEDLGGIFQFRTSLDVAYSLHDQSRLGVQFAHVSNAGLRARNPGDNELLFTYGIPLSF